MDSKLTTKEFLRAFDCIRSSGTYWMINISSAKCMRGMIMMVTPAG